MLIAKLEKMLGRPADPQEPRLPRHTVRLAGEGWYSCRQCEWFGALPDAVRHVVRNQFAVVRR